MRGEMRPEEVVAVVVVVVVGWYEGTLGNVNPDESVSSESLTVIVVHPAAMITGCQNRNAPTTAFKS